MVNDHPKAPLRCDNLQRPSLSVGTNQDYLPLVGCTAVLLPMEMLPGVFNVFLGDPMLEGVFTDDDIVHAYSDFVQQKV